MHLDLFRLGSCLDFTNCMAGRGAETAYAIVAAIIGPGIPILTWLILTYSYRQDKQMIIRETGKHVTEEDLGPGVITNPLSRTLSSAVSSRDTGAGDPLIVANPVLHQVRQTSNPSAVQQTARQIVVRSLRRWDAFLGFRASRDGLGTPLSVWRPKFEGVRFAVLLLAIRKLNKQLQTQTGIDNSPPPGEFSSCEGGPAPSVKTDQHCSRKWALMVHHNCPACKVLDPSLL